MCVGIWILLFALHIQGKRHKADFTDGLKWEICLILPPAPEFTVFAT